MKIVVTDACIFIDLFDLGLIHQFFDLNIEVHTTIDVVGELYPEQRNQLENYHSKNKLSIKNLTFQEIIETNKLMLPKGLSAQDRSVLYLAIKLENSILLSSDGLLRKCAHKFSIEYHGLIWIFDNLISSKVLSKENGILKLNKLLKTNKMYANQKLKVEIDKRLNKWMVK